MTCSENHDAFERRVAEDMERLAKGMCRGRCGYGGCKKQSNYGFTRGKTLSCAKHMYDHPETKEKMKRVTHLCTFTENGLFTCFESAIYGPKRKGSGGISCRLHRDQMASCHGGGLCLKTGKECQTDGCYGIGLYYLKATVNNTTKNYLCGKCVPRHGTIVDPLYERIRGQHKCKVTEGCDRIATYYVQTDRMEKRVACASCAKKHPHIYKRVLAPSETCITCLQKIKEDPEHIKKRKLYGYADPTTNETLTGTALYCEQCKPDGTVDLKNPLCATPHCLVRVITFGDKCAYCNERTRIRRKEIAVGEALEGISGDWINNKTMDDKSCGMYRPDFRLVLWDRIIIVECNEYAHTSSSYSASCENKRSLDIHGSANGLPVIIISFNPDLKTASGTPIGSGYPTNIRTRLSKLIKAVRDAMACQVTQGMLNVWYLYHGTYIPFIDEHRPSGANVCLPHKREIESIPLRRFDISVDHGIADELGNFHPLVRELPI